MTNNPVTNQYVLPPAPRPSIAVTGSDKRFPVRRIFCVGRNYAEHIREMGGNADKDMPVFFTKPADAICKNSSTIPYPMATGNLHYEVELVVALDRQLMNASAIKCRKAIFGLAVGVDLTRRDLQKSAKQKGEPWDAAKAFDNSAPVSDLCRWPKDSPLPDGKISLSVNGLQKQSSRLSHMIRDLPSLIADLSSLFSLLAGDLIFTGTPYGVGPLVPQDAVHAQIDDVGSLTFQIGNRLC